MTTEHSCPDLIFFLSLHHTSSLFRSRCAYARERQKASGKSYAYAREHTARILDVNFPRDLIDASEEVGQMDTQEVESALKFLHETGSVLHYSAGTRRGNQKMAKIGFIRPQNIIDAIKHVIQEA